MIVIVVMNGRRPSGLLLLLADPLQGQLHLVHLQPLVLVQLLLDVLYAHRWPPCLGCSHRLLAGVPLLDEDCLVELDRFGVLPLAAESEGAAHVPGVHELGGEELVEGEREPVEVDGGGEEAGEGQRGEGQEPACGGGYLRYLT